MSQPLTQTMPVLHGLPITLPRDGAVQLEFEQGVLIFRASQAVQDVVEKLLSKQSTQGLSQAEDEELEQYEAIDDYLSFTNRLLRNLKQANEEGSECPSEALSSMKAGEDAIKTWSELVAQEIVES